MTEKVELQDAFDALTNRVKALEAEAFAARAREDVLNSFLACQLLTHPSPEKIEKVWEVFVSDGLEKKLLAGYEKSDVFEREDIGKAIKNSLKQAIALRSETLKSARNIKEK